MFRFGTLGFASLLLAGFGNSRVSVFDLRGEIQAQILPLIRATVLMILNLGFASIVWYINPCAL